MESISSLSLGTNISNRSLDKKLKNLGMCLSALDVFPDFCLLYFKFLLLIKLVRHPLEALNEG